MGGTPDASAGQSKPRPLSPNSGISLPEPPSLPAILDGDKKRKKETILPQPGRRAHDEKRFLLSVVSVEFPLPTRHDLLAAHPVFLPSVFHTPGLVGEGVKKTPLMLRLGTQSPGVGVSANGGMKGSPRTSLRQVIFPFLVFRERVGVGRSQRGWGGGHESKPSRHAEPGLVLRMCRPQEGHNKLMEADGQSQAGHQKWSHPISMKTEAQRGAWASLR